MSPHKSNRYALLQRPCSNEDKTEKTNTAANPPNKSNDKASDNIIRLCKRTFSATDSLGTRECSARFSLASFSRRSFHVPYSSFVLNSGIFPHFANACSFASLAITSRLTPQNFLDLADLFLNFTCYYFGLALASKLGLSVISPAFPSPSPLFGEMSLSLCPSCSTSCYSSFRFRVSGHS